MHNSHPIFRLPLLICLLGMFLLLAGVCQAQVSPVADSTQTDTVPQNFNDRLLENLKEMSQRKTIMGKLLKAVLVLEKAEEVYGLNAELIQQEYEKHNYKIVRRIDILTLDALGYSINDTSKVPDSFMEKAGNSLHVKTGRGQVRNKLLFRKMEPLEPLALIESERLLRQSRHLLDARIVVNEATTTEDSVDVFVVTKDIFSLGGSGSYTPSSGKGRVSLRELNFLGQGHQVEGSYRFNLHNRPRPWEVSSYYSIENIGRSYVSADMAYVDKNYYKEKSAFLSRDFFSTNTKYAGAVGISWIEERFLLPSSPEDTLIRYGTLSFNRQDVWLGRSFKFKTYNLGYEPRSRVILGLRFINTNYGMVPTENFQDNRLALVSAGYSIRKYYKDRYLFGFGRTEDVPAGTLFSITAGYEKGDLRDRKYFGTSLSFAKYNASLGYLYASASYGSFIRNEQLEQGVLGLETLYFTKLSEWGNWKLRHFVWGRGTLGINRYPEELLSINNESGLRGFRSHMLRGSRRVTLNYEANLYTPLSLLGFRLATVLFADVAWLSSGNQSSPFKEAPYRGYGIGFRFRNEFLSFSTIQFLISYYPKLPQNDDLRGFRVFESSRPYYDFRDFQFTRPGVADFR
ncbi:hypothetical protein CLV24_10549 [Pontibacter ummariensis]|uniref:Outer membrane protein assembly factor BamA n=1 Tax=Pontibacter ummariensis TaxID=1610492 RepID=A0A239DYY1_9BACT|nr:hypothetical protein [Pontibacter ummariensis]PRY13679.1 hypothetical protein CLV24_10549 [Pontibacter ummariensis]SNS37680.1 hypothetical protein SAMN06296052_105202 [Pontibacter ummariensis]